MNVTFHFNTPDKLGYACRLLRKVYRGGIRTLVVGDDTELTKLDRALWEFDQQEFIPHWRATPGRMPAPRLQDTPIWLGQAPADAACTLLVNLGPEMPPQLEGFERINELVSSDPADREHARERWKRYAAMGCTILRHEVPA